MIQHTMISTGGHLTILESVDSTNNYAMAMVRTGLAKPGDGYFAMAQVKGKGQRGKTWFTEPGTNIILTLVLQPSPLQLSQQFQLSIAITLAVCDFFAGYAGDETKIKWPNDIYWRDRKAGGILIENVIVSRQGLDESVRHETTDMSDKTDTPAPGINYENNFEPIGEGLAADTSNLPTWPWAIIGMGININQTSFSENIRNAVSLKQITGKDWDVVELTKALCSHVQRRYEQLKAGKNLLPEYNQQLFKKNETVTFKKGSRIFKGTVKEVNLAGKLVVMTSMEECFGFGEIEWVLK